MSDEVTTGTVAVDEEHIQLPRALDPSATYDVLLNDRHVWSLNLARDTETKHGHPVAEWPKALRPYLHGRAEVVVRDHVTGTRLASTRHVFGDDDTEEVTVVDSAGHPLVLDKWGRLTRPISAEDRRTVDDLMDAAERLLDDLREKAGVPGYICYGTLLGAVRNGRLIGHDNDIDLAYVSELPDPVDVVRESYRVERALRDAGWTVRRGSGARINVRMKLPDGSMRFIDVFTSHWVEGVLYIPSDTGFLLPKETILPLTTVELEGRQVPAPAQSERLLAATYGESWRVPDPSFKYETPRWLVRHIGGWFGGLMTHRKHWDSFISKSSDKVPDEPTLFAQWVAENYRSARPLIDLGTGTGRDAFWFAEEHGRSVTGIDYCVGAVNRGNRITKNKDLPATFELANLYDNRAVLALGARLARLDEPVDLYARFTLHALDRPGQDNLLRLASMSLRRGGLLFLEFRTLRDRDRRKVFDDHARHYVRPATLVRRIEASGGRILERVGGVGMAPFRVEQRSENPHVCRIVATWSDS
jgi:hypothetical protein